MFFHIIKEENELLFIILLGAPSDWFIYIVTLLRSFRVRMVALWYRPKTELWGGREKYGTRYRAQTHTHTYTHHGLRGFYFDFPWLAPQRRSEPTTWLKSLSLGPHVCAHTRRCSPSSSWKKKDGGTWRWDGKERLLLGEITLTGLDPISLRKLPAKRRGSGPANGACMPLASASPHLLRFFLLLRCCRRRLTNTFNGWREGGIHRGSAITHANARQACARTRSVAMSKILFPALTGA